MTGSLVSFVLRRVGAAVVFVVLVASASLLLVRASPGDAVTDLALSVADETTVAAARARLGLNEPPWWQWWHWMAGLTRGDLGESSRFGRPVAELVIDRALHTAWLALLALGLATALGVPIGLLTGTRAGPFAGAVGVLAVLLVACPPIVATLLLLYFAVATGWLPVSPGSLALPLLALALPTAATIERLQSRAAADMARRPDIVAAAARGISARRLRWIHTLRPALRPVVGVYGIIIATLFSGSIAVETIASWPGLGRLMLDALVGRDVYLVSGCALVGAALIAAGNLAADVIGVALDPRLREAR